jgi:peroxiredoxin
MDEVQTRKRFTGRNKVLILASIGGALILLGALAWVLMSRVSATSSKSKPGKDSWAFPVEVNFPAPELSLTDLQDNPVSLADFKGRVVLVNNWATWCPPCKAEMPTLQAYYEDHKDQGFEIVAIEAGEPVAEVAEFSKQYGLNFKVWPDSKQKALTAFRSFSLPNSYVIDEDGQVRLAWFGPINRKMLEEYVTPLLKD